MRVLGIDPGTATTGYGIVDFKSGREHLVGYGTIKTAAGLAMSVRLYQIKRELVQIIQEHQPQMVAVEELFYNRNSRTVISVAESRGVILMTAAEAGLPIAEYTPLQVKQSVVGYGNADKKQVQLMVQRILKIDHIPRPDDAADALAIAICCLHSYQFAKLN
ncbi:MAG: crossover junction endodeoxyribonuclease RuvC [Syntrophomonadaceae bacterium]|jgi:crossover junction endodeoxyribonuclease RuvC